MRKQLQGGKESLNQLLSIIIRCFPCPLHPLGMCQNPPLAPGTRKRDRTQPLDHSQGSFPEAGHSHSFIIPMSTQRLSRQAWQCRRLSLVMWQSPLKGQVNMAFLFMLLLEKSRKRVKTTFLG